MSSPPPITTRGILKLRPHVPGCETEVEIVAHVRSGNITINVADDVTWKGVPAGVYDIVLYDLLGDEIATIPPSPITALGGDTLTLSSGLMPHTVPGTEVKRSWSEPLPKLPSPTPGSRFTPRPKRGGKTTLTPRSLSPRAFLPRPGCTEDCAACDGTGKSMRERSYDAPSGSPVRITDIYEPCFECDGTGKVAPSTPAPTHTRHTRPITYKEWDEMVRRGVAEATAAETEADEIRRVLTEKPVPVPVAVHNEHCLCGHYLSWHHNWGRCAVTHCGCDKFVHDPDPVFDPDPGNPTTGDLLVSPCPTCDGTGEIEDDETCPICFGARFTEIVPEPDPDDDLRTRY